MCVNEQGTKPIYREIVGQKARENQFKLEGITFKYIECHLLCQRGDHIVDWLNVEIMNYIIW